VVRSGLALPAPLIRKVMDVGTRAVRTFDAIRPAGVDEHLLASLEIREVADRLLQRFGRVSRGHDQIVPRSWIDRPRLVKYIALTPMDTPAQPAIHRILRW